MGIYKICSRCGRIVETGKECECLKAYRRSYKANRDKKYDKEKRDKRSREFYMSRTWRECRKNILDSDEIDIYLFMTSGKMIPADTVHHIVPLRDDWTKRYARDNLMSLSAGTHSAIEYMYRQDKEKMIDELSKMTKEFRNMKKNGEIYKKIKG